MRLDERVEHWARQAATKRGISLSRFVEELLEEHIATELLVEKPWDKSNQKDSAP